MSARWPSPLSSPGTCANSIRYRIGDVGGNKPTHPGSIVVASDDERVDSRQLIPRESLVASTPRHDGSTCRSLSPNDHRYSDGNTSNERAGRRHEAADHDCGK